jgi:hypothetical protein
MRKKFKILSEDVVNNLIEFLDEIQFDAAKENTNEDMHKINFCNWAISELLNSYDGYLRETPKKKKREDYVDETFMDWNLPEMSDEEYEKLVDQFDAFLRGWEKEYNKKHPQKKKIKKRKQTFKPNVEDIAEYMSLEEIKEYLLEDEELSDYERFELYYEEHRRVQKEKERKKLARGAKPIDDILKELDIKPHDPKDDKEKK